MKRKGRNAPKEICLGTWQIEHKGSLIHVSQAAYEQWNKADKKEQAFLWNLWTDPDLKEQIGKMTQQKAIEPAVADSVAATLAQRGSRYGDFTDHARVCQALKRVMEGTTDYQGPNTVDPLVPPRGWHNLSDVQKQALEVIADKIARILTGDPNYDDNWHDIQGYAKLVEDRLPKESK